MAACPLFLFLSSHPEFLPKTKAAWHTLKCQSMLISQQLLLRFHSPLPLNPEQRSKRRSLPLCQTVPEILSYHIRGCSATTTRAQEGLRFGQLVLGCDDTASLSRPARRSSRKETCHRHCGLHICTNKSRSLPDTLCCTSLRRGGIGSPMQSTCSWRRSLASRNFSRSFGGHLPLGSRFPLHGFPPRRPLVL